MKNWIKNFFGITQILAIFAISVFAGSHARADEPPRSFEIQPEVSAVLIHPQFAKALAGVKKLAQENGRLITLSRVDITQAENIHVEFEVRQRVAADVHGTWSFLGSIVGVVQFGPQGELVAMHVYYKPGAD